MNILLRELKANRKSLILWSIAVLVMVFGGMSKYAGISGSAEMMNELMAGMPKSLQAVMGVGELDLSKASGYYGVLYLYLILMGAVHAAILGANIISKEERDLTAEFLMAKPVARSGILTAKLAAAVLNILMINAVTLVSSLIAVRQYGSGDNTEGQIISLMAGMFLLQLLYLCLSVWIAAACRRPKRAVTYSTAVLLVTFILSAAIDISGRIDALSYFTPFKYFEAEQMISGAGMDAVSIVLTFSLIALSLAAAYVQYGNRDLSI